MTKSNERGRSLAPRSSKAIDDPTVTGLQDPITVAMEVAAGDDPSIAELVAFRRQPLDLKTAARNAKNLHSEEFRVWMVMRAASPGRSRRMPISIASASIGLSAAFMAQTYWLRPISPGLA